MNEQEAITTITTEFSGEEGLLARLRRGEGLDEATVQHIFTALNVLKAAWADSSCVPKHVVLAMARTDDAIASLADQYPDLQLPTLQIEPSSQIEECFRPREWALVDSQLPPDSPAAFLVDVFLAEHPFLLDLRCGRGINYATVTRILDAIDTLRVEWAEHKQIPKAASMVLVGAGGAVLESWGTYWNRPNVQQEILALAGDVQWRVIRGLSEETDPQFRQMTLGLTE